MSESSSKKRCLVTGASGFVARYLIPLLVEEGREVFTTASGELPVELSSIVTAHYDADLRSRTAIAEVVADVVPEEVVHLGAMAFVPGIERARADACAVNVLGTNILMEACAEHAPGVTLLFTSSAHVYALGEGSHTEDAPIGPSSFYGITKRAAEEIALYYARDGIRVLIARAFNQIGPGQTPSFVTSSFAHQIATIERSGRPGTIRVGNLDSERDFTDVRDTVRGYVAMLAPDVEAGVYNVASGRPVSIQRILDGLLAWSEAEIVIEKDAARIRKGEPARITGDVRKLREATGWQPAIALEESLRDILAQARDAQSAS